MIRFLSFLTGIFVAVSLSAQVHVEAMAEKGDGILSFLERYQVRGACDQSYFYQINRLKKGQGLQAGKTYLLPIIVYTYNGKSIRSSTGKSDLEWAEKIQEYNEAMLAWKLKPGDFRTDRQLWVPYHQLYCPAEDQPLRLPGQTAAPATRVAASGKQEVAARSEAGPMPKLPMKDSPLRGTYPIFGSKYANVPLDETDLSGKVFYISSGHGGPDPGAVGKFGTQSLCEDEYAYDISLRLAHNLLSRGATVYIIVRDPDDGIREGEILPCDKDENFWLDKDIAVPQSDRLFQNSEVINELYRKNLEQGVKDQRLVVIHVDSNSQSEQIDMFFYYKPGDEQSKTFAETVHQTIKQKYEVYRKSRGYEGTVTPRDLHMLRETEPTAVFIELGNIRNSNDQARLVIEGNRQLIANWLLEGILKDVK